jgi:glucokinase
VSPPPSRRIVGLDFGGSAIKGGAITHAGEILEESSIPTDLQSGAASVLDRAAAFARQLGAGDETPLGVGCPGLIGRENGTILDSPNLPQLEGLALAEELARRIGLTSARVRLENDANVAALGELWLGAARGRQNVLVLTLGTGIGGGLILDGNLYSGPHGRAGEIGHVSIEPSAAPCASGVPGCLEGFASATAASRRARERGLPEANPGNLELLATIARQAAGPERDLFVEIGRDLGHGLALTSVLLDLTSYVFGGGFSATLDLLEPGIRSGLTERSFGQREIELMRAELGPSAGWIGAASLHRTT